jgi:transcriptional regulator with XRE-family HTH domain
LVKNTRARKGLTQTDVARLVFNDEEAKSRVSDVENGRNEPQADTINRFCEALGIPYEDVEALRTPKSIISEWPLLHLDIRPVPGFTGREDLLAGVDAALWQQGGTAALTNASASAAVKGLGGVGKSVLAREYAWRARERYHGVWWVRAETEQTLIDDLIDLGSRLRPNLKEMPERGRALHLALDAIAGSATADKPWLIVYDNVEKPSAIARLTPKTSAHILITSRWPRWQSPAQELPVDVFQEETAVDFLLAERPHETHEAASRLAAALGYLPLALSHARAYCAETNLSFDDYARRLPELIQEAPEDAEYPASVFATFSLAIAKAAEACPEAEKLMEIAAFLAPERIPLDIITDDVMSVKQREKAIATLFKVSLIGHDISAYEAPNISIHRLVQEAMRAGLGNQEAQDAIAITWKLLASATSADNGTYDWRYRQLLSEHIAALSHRTEFLELLDNTNAVQALRMHAAKLSDDIGQLIQNTKEQADRAISVAERLQVAKDKAEARKILEGALAICVTVLGQNHPTTATIRASCGALGKQLLET